MFTMYGGKNDKKADKNSQYGKGNNENTLLPGSVALSPDLVGLLRCPPGSSLYAVNANGQSIYLGQYNDQTEAHLTNYRVDLFAPNGNINGFGQYLQTGWSIIANGSGSQTHYPFNTPPELPPAKLN